MTPLTSIMQQIIKTVEDHTLSTSTIKITFNDEIHTYYSTPYTFNKFTSLQKVQEHLFAQLCKRHYKEIKHIISNLPKAE